MRIKKRPFHFLLLAILFAIGLVYMVLSYPPDFAFGLYFFTFPVLLFFFLLSFLFIFSLLTYLTYKKTQGLLVGLTIFTYFLLRFFGLTHIFFTGMLLALFVTLELFFLKKK